MKFVALNFVVFVILAHAVVWAQPGNGSSDTLAFENGSIKDNLYTNECFGFSLSLPAGWQLNAKVIGGEGKAKHAVGQLILLLLEQDKENSPGNRIIVTARDASGSTLEDFVSKSVHSAIDTDREHRQIVKDTYPVDYGGKTFSRADYKQTMSSGGTLYDAVVYTKFRGYYIGETVMSGSPEELDQSANSLAHISFREDEPNPKCVMSGDNSASTGNTGGVINSKPGTAPPDLSLVERVRVSSGVTTGLLIKKVAPRYPDDAKQAGVQGRVVLQALIDKNGDIQSLTLVSGHPMLAPAAIEAVKKWKYKPYLLEGKPVSVETQIIVNFSLRFGR
ncbi:MAG: energy transducer TonB [Terriglobales bacterium]